MKLFFLLLAWSSLTLAALDVDLDSPGMSDSKFHRAFVSHAPLHH